MDYEILILCGIASNIIAINYETLIIIYFERIELAKNESLNGIGHEKKSNRTPKYSVINNLQTDEGIWLI